MIDFPRPFDPCALAWPHGPDHANCDACDVGRRAIGHVSLDELERRVMQARLERVARFSRGEQP